MSRCRDKSGSGGFSLVCTIPSVRNATPRLQSPRSSIKLVFSSRACLKPGWRNWQTQRTQNPPVLSTLGVRLPLPAPDQPIQRTSVRQGLQQQRDEVQMHNSWAVSPQSCPNCFCEAAADFCWAAASAWSRCCFASRAVIASLMSRSETMAYLSNHSSCCPRQWQALGPEQRAGAF